MSNPEQQLTEADHEVVVEELSNSGPKQHEPYVIEKGELFDIVHEVENLNEADALVMAPALVDAGEASSFRMGGVLSRIRAKEWYAPHETFEVYVEQEVGMSARKARDLMAIYRAVQKVGADTPGLCELPWTKLRKIARLLNEENVDLWIERAHSLNHEALDLAVRSSKQPTEVAKAHTEPMRFKVDSDQRAIIVNAIDKAKANSSTKVNTVALEYICIEYVSGTHVSFIDRLRTAGMEVALSTLADAFPGKDFEVAMPDEEGSSGQVVEAG